MPISRKQSVSKLFSDAFKCRGTERTLGKKANDLIYREDEIHGTILDDFPIDPRCEVLGFRFESRGADEYRPQGRKIVESFRKRVLASVFLGVLEESSSQVITHRVTQDVVPRILHRDITRRLGKHEDELSLCSLSTSELWRGNAWRLAS